MDPTRFTQQNVHTQHTSARGNGEPAPQDVLRQIPELLGELKEYTSYYISARKDAAGARFRSLLARAALGILALLMAMAVVGTSTWLLLTGLAHGLGILFGGRIWLGYAVMGLVILVATGTGTWLGIRYWKRSALQATREKYEQMRQEQKQRFQRCVSDLAPVSCSDQDESTPS